MASPFYFDDSGYFWTIKWFEPVNSEVQEVTQEVLFNRLGNARTKEIMRLAVEKNKQFQETGEIQEDTTISDELLADEILGGWQNMKNRAGEDIPYTPENKAKFLDREGIASAIVGGWFESKKTRTEGNSEAPPVSSGS